MFAIQAIVAERIIDGLRIKTALGSTQWNLCCISQERIEYSCTIEGICIFYLRRNTLKKTTLIQIMEDGELLCQITPLNCSPLAKKMLALYFEVKAYFTKTKEERMTDKYKILLVDILEALRL